MKTLQIVSAATPIFIIVYAALDYFGTLDALTGRSKALEALDRLRSTAGYPDNWIKASQDRPVFEAIRRRIEKKSRVGQNCTALKNEGYLLSQIVSAGSPIPIEGVDPGWPQEQRAFYSEGHPVLFLFDVQGETIKALRVCSLGDLNIWLSEEKQRRDFWFATILIGMLSVSLAIYAAAAT